MHQRSWRDPVVLGLAGAPQGLVQALGPLVGPLGHSMERTIWTGLKRKLEAKTAS